MTARSGSKSGEAFGENTLGKKPFREDVWALILGGSSGFGLATAQRLAEAGANLCIVHRDRRASLPGIQAEFEKLRGTGVRVITWNTDALAARKRAAVLDELAEALGSNGRVRVLLHSIAFGHLKLLATERPRAAAAQDARGALAAALGVDESQLARAADDLFAQGLDALEGLATPEPMPDRSFLDAEDFARTIHCMGTSLLDWTQDLLERDLLAPDTRVFGLTSEGNAMAWKGYAAVAAAKAALEALARSMATELAPYGIRCNVLQPGVTDTPALAAIPGSARLKAQARRRNPFGRLTTPRDVANVIYLLSLDEAAWINGALIRVDGGEHVSGAYA